jgi:hypothetical protein
MVDNLMDWKRFLSLLAGMEQSLQWLVDKADPRIQQEAVQQMVMSLAQGYHALLLQDPQHPQFFSLLNPVIKSAAPNPDYMYYSALVEAGGVYRVSGFRGTNLFTIFSVGGGLIGVSDVPGPTYLNVDIDTLRLDERRNFSFILSAQRPDGYEGDWFPLDPRAEAVSVRVASYDWIAEVDGRYAIERLDGSPLHRRWTPEEIAARLERLAGFHVRYSKIFLGFTQQFEKRLANEMVENTWAAIGGLAKQAYFESRFEFTLNEVLIIETDVPKFVRYWSVLLADPLFNTIDWDKCQSSLNGHQARVDSDGKFRAVISIADPAVPNWLDPAGHLRGIIQCRWFDADSFPTPRIKRIQLTELRKHVPPDTPTISSEQRKEALLARFRGAQFRRKW